MPDTPHHTEQAQETRTARRRRDAAVRLALGIVFVFAAMAVPQLADPEPAAAGASCTGWTSEIVPPQTIRVLRTRSGKVEKVSFRRYVAEVMASGEWPNRLKMATLEAGALATKQYAWYYALKGHHRSGYSKGGKCFDVRDDVLDQLYRPNKATPTDRQWKAVNTTWDLSLRKKGRFFLTGYRAGSTETCGKDANGWKLYAQSVNACAKKGWSSTRILKRYLDPNLTIVRSDRMGPVLKKPGIALKVGNELPGAATVSWKPVVAGANVDRYVLQRKTGDSQWKRVEVDDDNDKWVDTWLKTGVKNRFRVKGVDGKSRSGPWAYSARRTAAIRGPVGMTLSDGAQTADAEPLKAKTRFTGRSAALVTETGPGMGSVKIFVDGKKVAIVDLERASHSPRKLVWTKNWDVVKERSIAVKALDVTEPVEFGGFYTLR